MNDIRQSTADLEHEPDGRDSNQAALDPPLTEAERHRLRTEWNLTAVDYPRDRCIHQLFALSTV